MTLITVFMFCAPANAAPVALYKRCTETIYHGYYTAQEVKTGCGCVEKSLSAYHGSDVDATLLEQAIISCFPADAIARVGKKFFFECMTDTTKQQEKQTDRVNQNAQQSYCACGAKVYSGVILSMAPQDFTINGIKPKLHNFALEEINHICVKGR